MRFQSNIFLLMSTLIRELPSSTDTCHAYLASSQLVQARPTRAFPQKGHWSQKDHQSLGLEDLKCKVQELSAEAMFSTAQRGSLQRKNHGNTQNKEEFEQPWNPSYRSSWPQPRALSSPHCLAQSFLGLHRPLSSLKSKVVWFTFLSPYPSVLGQES